LHSFFLQFFKLETFLNTGQGELIANSINRTNKANYLFIFQDLDHEDDHRQLVNPNLQCLYEHFFDGVLVINLDEVEFYQGLCCRN
jgi:hypothetical protein